MVDDDDLDRDELEDAVKERFEELYADTYSWEVSGRDSFIRDLDQLSNEDLEQMLEFSDEEMEQLAEYQEEDAPDWLLEMGWYDDDGDWHNPFWYH